ncbi:MAG: ABC transporter ATP-binding protein [Alphaproteobacteria bacterium]|nr:ABC transporter ATP-binding protein [Alphaproteobacteria bacterium]
MASLQLAELTKRYGASTAVDGLTLAVDEGAFVALVGPSGCGKTTTLRMIAGLIEPDGGRILIGGGEVTREPVHRRNIGLVFQSYALFPHMSVFENVAFGLRRRGLDDVDRRVGAALERVRLGGFAARRPRELSGGQQQRVALARAIVIEPRLLLLDEPLSNLDAALREDMRAELRRLQQDLGITTLLVTHDQAEALTMADRIAVLNRGRLEQYDTPETIYRRPANAFVAQFVGRANFIGTSLAVRPESIRVLARPEPGYETRAAQVVVAAFAGAAIHYTLRLDDGGELRAHAAPEAPPHPAGSRVVAAWRPEDAIRLPGTAR